MFNQVSSGDVRVDSNSQCYLRSHHTDITCIDNACRVSKGSSNMYRAPTMAKVNILCYVHLLNRFRVNKGGVYSRTMFLVLYRVVPTFLGNSCAPYLCEQP